MLLIDGNVIDLSIEEGETIGLYNIKMFFDGILYTAIYSVYDDFIYSSFDDKDPLREYKLNIVRKEVERLISQEN